MAPRTLLALTALAATLIACFEPDGDDLTPASCTPIEIAVSLDASDPPHAGLHAAVLALAGSDETSGTWAVSETSTSVSTSVTLTRPEYTYHRRYFAGPELCAISVDVPVRVTVTTDDAIVVLDEEVNWRPIGEVASDALAEEIDFYGQHVTDPDAPAWLSDSVDALWPEVTTPEDLEPQLRLQVARRHGLLEGMLVYETVINLGDGPYTDGWILLIWGDL